MAILTIWLKVCTYNADPINVNSLHRLTSQIPGATVVENVELNDLVSFSRNFDPGAEGALDLLVRFTASLMTGIGLAALLPRIQSILNGRNRTEPSPLEHATVTYGQAPSLGSAAELLERYSRLPETHLYRPEMLRCCIAALRMAMSGTHTFHQAVLQIRDKARCSGRPLNRRAVGSTLLLKGLEADVAVLLEPSRDGCSPPLRRVDARSQKNSDLLGNAYSAVGLNCKDNEVVPVPD